MATRSFVVGPQARRRCLVGAAIVASVCGLSSSATTAQQSVRSIVVLQRPTTKAPHAYFESLAARTDVFGAYSLRSQTQLDELVRRPPSTYFRYVWPADDYARPQDAAKLEKRPRKELVGNAVGDESIAGNQTLRIPLGISSGRVLITWDVWWGEEFQTNTGTLDAWKTFFVTTGRDGGNVYWLAHDHIRNANAAAGEVSKHHDGPVGDPKLADAPGVIRSDPFQPTGLGAVPMRSFATMFNRWTRYWLEIQMDMPGTAFTEWNQLAIGGAPLKGTWDMMSLWIADEERDPVRVLYRVPAPRADSTLSEFRLAWNTSTHNRNGGGLTGPLIAYARNVVILRNAEVRDMFSPGSSAQRPAPPRNVRIIR